MLPGVTEDSGGAKKSYTGMSILKKKRLAVATGVYWVLLLYIVAALVWWFIALQRQNHQMAQLKLEQLTASDPAFLEKSAAISNEEKIRRGQYLGEGTIFMFLILVGAVFVFRAVRRQLIMGQQQQNFMMAVTHELKTPIAVAKLNLETLLRHKLDEGKQQKLIHATLEEAERLNTLASNILISSKLEGGDYQLQKEQIRFSELVNHCTAAFQRRFPDRKIVADIHEGLVLEGDSILLQIMVNNLLENALKYSPREGNIRISLQIQKGMAQLQVSDEGPGIPDAEKKKVFDRFYRIGNEQVRKTKGTGLGLYLCKIIAADHRGSIQVRDHIPAGSIFAVQIPI
jgi:two-component system, OmpR family, sensor histidine kinase CiaH